MNRIDRILSAIDTGLQEAADMSYEAPDLVGRCWRCRRNATPDPDVTCDPCRWELTGVLGEPHGPWTQEHRRPFVLNTRRLPEGERQQWLAEYLETHDLSPWQADMLAHWVEVER